MLPVCKFAKFFYETDNASLLCYNLKKLSLRKIIKGIGTILFGISMFLLGILAAVMLNHSDWYLWFVLIILSLSVGVIAEIIGMIQLYQANQLDIAKKN